jgi:ATP-dependent DNA helicase RecG
MTDAELSALLDDLLAFDDEMEWVEFKHNNVNPQEIGEYVSALANSAALNGQETAYMAWGIEDGTYEVIGTTFKPPKTKGKGNEDLGPWLVRLLDPQLNIHFHEWKHRKLPVVLLQIPRATHRPVAFQGERYIRVGSYTKPLKSLPAKERALWESFTRTSFERGIAKANIAADEVLTLIDFSGCFDLLKIPLPSNRAKILKRLAEETVIVAKPGGLYDVTNLGAVLFAKSLGQFHHLGRKAIRIIKYKGSGRTVMEREWRDPPSQRGYALAFVSAVAFINSQLPQNEPIGQAFRREVRMYPETAIRELVANALIHQDFSVTGAGPLVEIFPDRMEITNPGEPLVDTLRFIDTPPRSRNEGLAALMRRMNICEEGGTGIDKVVDAIEAFQLPAPDFTAITTMQPGSTKATLYAHQRLIDMDSKDRIRACYQHACLCHVSARKMTNTTLRQRFGIEEQNSAKASRIIAETVKAELIKPFDPDASKRYLSYVPFWA